MDKYVEQKLRELLERLKNKKESVRAEIESITDKETRDFMDGLEAGLMHSIYELHEFINNFLNE